MKVEKAKSKTAKQTNSETENRLLVFEPASQRKSENRNGFSHPSILRLCSATAGSGGEKLRNKKHLKLRNLETPQA